MIALALVLALSTAPVPQTLAAQTTFRGAAETPSDRPLLARIACVGASASGGFDLERFGPDWTLAHILQSASVAPLTNVLDAADTMLYLAPGRVGRKMIERALAHEPTLLFALDFPFWYGYGDQRGPAARMAFLDECLRLLSRFDCPIVVADFPDMHHALEAELPMLRPSQVPARQTIERLNQRLTDWAKERKNVTLVPLAAFLVDIRGRRSVRAGANTWEGDELEDLLQQDELHPTREGMVALGLLALDRLQQDRPELRGAFLTDRDAIAARAGGELAQPASTTAR